MDRRTLLKAGPALALSLVARGLFPPLVRAAASPARPGSEVIDEALEILEGFGPEYGGGLSNHAPMAAEALVALGRPDAVLPWVERYRGRLREPPRPVNAVSRDGWREALGDVRRLADWITFFERELAGAPWQSVLKSWVPRLAPGLIGAAAHCLIRTSHATRRLEERETPQRLRELAQGLGYWAARYQVLPGKPSGAGELPVAAAIGRVELLPKSLRRESGLITPHMLRLEKFPPFEDVIDLVDTSKGRPDFLSELTALFADVYLRNVDRAIAFVHAVTGPSALRILTPHVAEAAQSPAGQYAWQAAAGLYATFAEKRFTPTGEETAISPEDLIDRAVSNGNAHTIKFTEVCLREWRLSPRPVFLSAALDSTERLRPLR